MKRDKIVDVQGYVKENKVYREAYLDQPERLIGVVKNTEEEALQYFINRFVLIETKVNILLEQVAQVQNKGSYLTKAIQLQKDVHEFNAIGDFAPLIEKLENLEKQLKDSIVVNQCKNLEIKNALFAELQEATKVFPKDESEEPEWKIITEKILDIKKRWIKTGPVDAHLREEIETPFDILLEYFFNERREFYLKINKIYDFRIEQYETALAQARALSDNFEDSDKENTFKQARILQSQWKEIGEVPKEIRVMLFKKFNKVIKRIYHLYNVSKGNVSNTGIQTALQNIILEAEKLLNSPVDEMANAAQTAKELIPRWKKKIGVPPIDPKKATIFQLITDKIFELNFLYRAIQYRYPDFLDKFRSDQLRIQINQMNYLLKKERDVLEELILNPSPENKNLITIHKRKISVKQELINQFKLELSSLID